MNREECMKVLKREGIPSRAHGKSGILVSPRDGMKATDVVNSVKGDNDVFVCWNSPLSTPFGELLLPKRQ